MLMMCVLVFVVNWFYGDVSYGFLIVAIFMPSYFMDMIINEIVRKRVVLELQSKTVLR